LIVPFLEPQSKLGVAVATIGSGCANGISTSKVSSPQVHQALIAVLKKVQSIIVLQPIVLILIVLRLKEQVIITQAIL
jgi:hypothetical protein